MSEPPSVQAATLPADLQETAFSRFIFADPRLAPVWLVLRVLVGVQWLMSGWEKLSGGAWGGASSGKAITAFLNGALAKTGGDMPDVSGWYASFVRSVALPGAELFSYLVTFGELAIGIALILGLFTGLVAFFGAFLNMNFLLAGSLSTNPLLLASAVMLVLAWRVAGWWGLDRVVLPRILAVGSVAPFRASRRRRSAV
jgi:thiosulfate dehydrogenase (quinone) large subunit